MDEMNGRGKDAVDELWHRGDDGAIQHGNLGGRAMDDQTIGETKDTLRDYKTDNWERCQGHDGRHG